jgi:alpha-mannosidase
MNNHWGTNYRAYQEGPVEFRYALQPHGRFDPAAASRLAIGMSQSLLPAAASASATPPVPFLSIEPDDVLVTALKPSEDGKAWILRLFGASGQDRQAKLKWLEPEPTALSRSDLTELPLEPIHGPVNLSGWELLTIRAEHA